MIRVFREILPLETRAVAVAEGDRPISIFEWRHRGLDPRVRVGDIVAARVTKLDRAIFGIFLETETKEPLFVALKRGETAPPEGRRLGVEIQTESYLEKAARGRIVTDAPCLLEEATAFARWLSRWGEGVDVSETDTDAGAIIDAAYEEASSASLSLPGGGQLHLDFARAMTVMDVDSSGRRVQGGSLALNLEAVSEAARQIALRRIGGVVSIDVIGAPKGDASGGLVKAMRKGLRAFDRRNANVLPVNPFGLLELSLPRAERPLGLETSKEDYAAAAMRALCRALRDHRSGTLDMGIGGKLHDVLMQWNFDWKAPLIETFGARFSVRRDDACSDFSYVLHHE